MGQKKMSHGQACFFADSARHANDQFLYLCISWPTWQRTCLTVRGYIYTISFPRHVWMLSLCKMLAWNEALRVSRQWVETEVGIALDDETCFATVCWTFLKQLLAKICWTFESPNSNEYKYQVFLRRFRDPIRVPRIRENYHRVPKIWENRVPTDPYRVPNIFLKKTLINQQQKPDM